MKVAKIAENLSAQRAQVVKAKVEKRLRKKDEITDKNEMIEAYQIFKLFLKSADTLKSAR